MFRLGVDIGGTFTDIVMLGPNGSVFSKKVLSTPPDYSLAIEEGVRELLSETKVTAAQITEFAHATTIATNTIIERKGVQVALITTKGFRDVLEIGRFRTPHLYDLDFRKPDPLVERRLRFEVTERVNGKGEVLAELDLGELKAIADRIRGLEVAAVAVCFINAYVNPANERAAAEFLRRELPGLSVSTSSQLLPQMHEFERSTTTVINAYIRPVVERYVDSLTDRVASVGIRVPVMIMQSSGGTVPGSLAASNPVYCIESGPAAGVVGAQRIGELLGLGDLMVLDMGGTTAKASIVKNGQFTIMPEAEVGGGAVIGNRLTKGAGFPVQVPTIDIAEVGAGGGSIANVDPAGGMKVGPRSAGAAPGPICYDRGGADPTVTDANLVLGYLNPAALVGGELRLNFAKAEAAIAALGARLGKSAVETAYGIHLIANSNMMRALSGVSSERGWDPSQFTLFAMGGNGAVHCGNLAESLNIRKIIVPPVAGLFSALGLLAADLEHQLVGAFYKRLHNLKPAELQHATDQLVNDAIALLRSEGFGEPARQSIRAWVEMKYVSQASTLSIPFEIKGIDDEAITRLATDFNRAHDEIYGYFSTKEQYQLVAIKVAARGLALEARLPRDLSRAQEKISVRGERPAYFGPELGWLKTPVLPRVELPTAPVAGPLIVEEYDTTTVVRPGWQAALDGWRNVVLTKTPTH